MRAKTDPTFSFELETQGLIPRSINEIFQQVTESQASGKYTVVCSFL